VQPAGKGRKNNNNNKTLVLTLGSPLEKGEKKKLTTVAARKRT
jgi:hypothetical protein